MDDLPAEVTAPLADALMASTERETLWRALAATAAALLIEINYLDPALAERVINPLRELTLLR